MKTFINILLILCLLTAFCMADSELVSLYEGRMEAEKMQQKDTLELIDLALAEHYLSQEDYRTARRFLELSMDHASDSVLVERKLDIYRLDIIEGHFSSAESGLLSLYYYTEHITQHSRAAMLLGIIKALEGNYEEAKTYLIESVELQKEWDSSFEMQLDSLLQDAKKRKRVETAKWLSGFLPGTGQIYAKNPKGAVGAIGIAAFWGGWFVYDLLQHDYYSAALVLLWPWQRYHRGNIQNAGYSVESYNAVIEDEINQALLEYLSK